MVIFESKIINIGKLAPSFKEENMLILFGDDAPESLKNIVIT